MLTLPWSPRSPDLISLVILLKTECTKTVQVAHYSWKTCQQHHSENVCMLLSKPNQNFGSMYPKKWGKLPAYVWYIWSYLY